ncbi:amino acid adenylation domain-containing protein [Dactylosporangium roseum]|uniref:Amino acid adenylation domain-containing protein n=1 Tax=Dactylosporangium roseum TaxID=47989 RepID=A0ABY5ZF77_9ACTN|nr:non-ribosomal peptide synthetase [Dactylosporangium roseum]UWZ39402.1 amino acid adenylation domain-containing protein [Dactylosporangium roseum]
MLSAAAGDYSLAPFQAWLAHLDGQNDFGHTEGVIRCWGVNGDVLRRTVEELLPSVEFAHVGLDVAHVLPVLTLHPSPLCTVETSDGHVTGTAGDAGSGDPALRVAARRTGDAWEVRLRGTPLLFDALTMRLLQEAFAARLTGRNAAGLPIAAALRYARWQNLMVAKVSAPPGHDGGNAGDGGLLPAQSSPDGTPRWRIVARAIPDNLVDSACTRLGVTPTAALLGSWQVVLSRLLRQQACAIDVALDDRRRGVPPEAPGQLTPLVRWAPAAGPDAPAGDRLRLAERWLASTLGRPLLWQPTVAGPAPYSFHSVADGFRWSHAAGRVEADPVRPASVAGQVSLLVSPGQPGTRLARLSFDESRLAAADADALLGAIEDVVATVAEDADAVWRGRRRGAPTVVTPPSDVPVPLWTRIARRAAERPDAVALEGAGGPVTFGSLAGHVNDLAARLQNHGVGEDARVALVSTESPGMVAAMLGVLAAGAAYVPVSPGTPADRVRDMLTAAECTSAVVAPGLQDLVPAGVRTIPLPDTRDTVEPARRPVEIETSLDALAYMLFTSGTTGRPKGVMVTRRGLDRYVDWAIGAYHMATIDVAVSHSPAAFDLTVTSMLAPLAAGRTVRVLASGERLDALPAALSDARGALLKLTPAHLWLLSQWDADPNSSVETVVVGGENLGSPVVSRWLERHPSCRVFNEYGPTETVVGCTVHEVRGAPPGLAHVPIGRPITGARVAVCDEQGYPLVPGVAGELMIGGDGVARGYAGDPRQTAARFLPDPWGPPGSRMFATRDRVVETSAWGLRFLERMDRQLKWLGHRVEPAEIELALSRCDGVGDSVVRLVPRPGGDVLLVAYVVGRDGHLPDSEAVRRELAGVLPAYLLPTAIVPMASMPVNRNGKLDEAALPDPVRFRSEEPSETPMQEAVRQAWSEVLGTGPIPLDVGFFDLGATSFSVVQATAKLRASVGYDLTVATVFEHRTVRALAAHLEDLLAGRTGSPATGSRAVAREQAVARLRARREGGA